MRHAAVSAAIASMLLQACTDEAATYRYPVLGAEWEQPNPVAVPTALRPWPESVSLRVLTAHGIRIYECRTEQGRKGFTAWAIVGEEAVLFDSAGAQVATQRTGATWEHLDGSRLIGTVAARAAAPEPDAIEWLLLDTRATGPAGVFSGTTSVQRLQTRGGVAPAPDLCVPSMLGRSVRVAYSAEHIMYGAR